MKNLKSILVLIILTIAVVLLFQSCSKYEEGPKLSLYSKKKRVIGNWSIYNHSVDGVSVFDPEVYSSGELLCNNPSFKVKYSNTRRMNFYNWEFKDGAYIYTQEFIHNDIDNFNSTRNCYPYYDSYSQFETDGGEWEFSDDKKELILKPYFGLIRKKTFEIKKLEYSEMHIIGTIEGKKHDIYLTRKL